MGSPLPLLLSAFLPLCTPPLRLRLMPMPTMAPTAMAWPITATAMVLPTMDTAMATTTAMLIPMPTTDTTARGPLMPRLLPQLRLMLMLTTEPTAMVWLITDTAMDSPITVMATMDTTVMPIPMPTMDTMARGLLMPLPLLMLTMALMAMVWLITDMAMVLPTTAMPTMDTTDIPTPMDTTDIINL